ncbi:MAG: SH3 domain-containing protein [Alphaproteobacteria bacterium]|nr:SH3 domain-containing protein [Alphaproteobacteria bacterium]MCZ6510762.1 SH3 domain-containing protein [Alphaproteobacteria bacterium]
MKSVWIGITVLWLALVFPAAPTFADEGTSARSWQGTIRVKNLNVRGGPGEGYDIVARLKRGDKVTAVDQTGRWVRVIGLKPKGSDAATPEIEAWLHRSFVRLPKDFLAPEFGDAENAFVDWAIARGDLSELSIEGTERLSVILAAEIKQARAPLIAFEVGCAYRDQLKIAEAVTVTVWTEKGAAAGWIAQVSCP